jgi:hypothetical protein
VISCLKAKVFSILSIHTGIRLWYIDGRGLTIKSEGI